MGVQRFEPKVLGMIKNDMELALKVVEAKYGIAFKVGSASYDVNSFNTKVECFVANGAGDSKQIAFNAIIDNYGGNYCGITKEDYGKEVLLDGQKFKVCGISTSARKNFILIMDKSNREYKISKQTFNAFKIN